MERLTARNKDKKWLNAKCYVECDVKLCLIECCVLDNPCVSVQKILDRLFEIENILCDDEYEKEYDLDRLRVMMNQCMSMREEVKERFRITANIPIDRLKELVEQYNYDQEDQE